MRRAGTLLAILSAALLASPAFAQASPDTVRRVERQLQQIERETQQITPAQQTTIQRVLLDYGASVRFGYYIIDDAESDPHYLRQYDGRLFLRANLDDAHQFFGRLRFLWDDYNEGDDFDGRGDQFQDPIGDRWWYQYDLRADVLARTGERLDFNANAKVGKQYVTWGAGLTLSNVMYAGLFDIDFGDFGVVGLYGETASSDTVDFDGSRPGFDSSTHRRFGGVRLELRSLPNHRPYVYWLDQDDRNTRDQRTFPGPNGDIPTRFKYDSSYIGIGSTGNLGPALGYRVEAVYEYGRGLSNSFNDTTLDAVAQHEEDIRAWAALAGLTYFVRDINATRLYIEAVAGSGDDDRIESADTFGGNKAGTDDKAFNSLGYVFTGLALAPEPSNVLTLRAGISSFPWRRSELFRNMRVGLDGFLFTKLDSDAPTSVQTNDKSFMGGEIDVNIDWRITSDVSASVRYGLFIPGEAMPSGQDDLRNFLYVGVTYAF